MAFLLDDIILSPIKGVAFLAEKIRAQAKNELYDEDDAKRRLQALYREYEEGRIDDEEFEARESVLVEHLEAIMAHKEGGT